MAIVIERMRSYARSWTQASALCASLLSASCADEAPLEDVASNEAALYGDLDASGCDATDRALITQGHNRGMQAAMTDTFQSCMYHGMMHDYIPCPGRDAFESEDEWTRLFRAIDVSTSENANDVDVDCRNLADGRRAETDTDAWASTNDDWMRVDTDFLDGLWVSGITDFDRAILAGTMWHEAMHQHHYDHKQTDRNLTCGLPDMSDFVATRHSVNGIVDTCVVASAHESRLVALDGPTTESAGATFGIGVYRATDVGASPLLANKIGMIVLGPGLRVRYCDNADGTGPCEVKTNTRLQAVPNGLTNFPDMISYLDIEPVVLGFDEAHFEGDVEAFGYGTYKASRGQLGDVGNNRISSLFVPAGTRVRACRDEGVDGKGASCTIVTHDVSGPYWAYSDEVSFLEVTPVVTIYSEEAYFGSSLDLPLGIFQADHNELLPVGNDKALAIVVPPGLRARVCTDEWSGTGGGACRIFDRSASTLPSDIRYGVSYVQVTIPPPIVYIPPIIW